MAEKLSNTMSKSRMLWSCRRGMLELDILLNDFISNQYEVLEEQDHKALLALLDYPDAVLFDLLMGKSSTANQEIADVIKKIRSNHTH